MGVFALNILYLQKLRQFVKHSVLHFNNFHFLFVMPLKILEFFLLSVLLSSTWLMLINCCVSSSAKNNMWLCFNWFVCALLSGYIAVGIVFAFPCQQQEKQIFLILPELGFITVQNCRSCCGNTRAVLCLYSGR